MLHQLGENPATIVRATLERSGVAREQVGHVVMGNVIPNDLRDGYLGRVAAIRAGIPNEVPALNVNRSFGRAVDGKEAVNGSVR